MRVRQQDQTKRLKETCSGFGFKAGSTQMSTCMFDLFKLEKSAEQSRAAISSMKSQNQAIIDSMDSNELHITQQEFPVPNHFACVKEKGMYLYSYFDSLESVLEAVR